MSTASKWRLWFVMERLHLHELLIECLDVSESLDQKAIALYEHDKVLGQLAIHTAKRVARADLATVLARREEEME